MVTTNYSSDWAFSAAQPSVAGLWEDRNQGTDYSLGDLRIAFRRRRFRVSRFSDIALRHSRLSGRRTEVEKLIDGSCQAHVYIFEFEDVWVIASVAELVAALKAGRYEVRRGPDGSMAVIALSTLPHLKVPKQNT